MRIDRTRITALTAACALTAAGWVAAAPAAYAAGPTITLDKELKILNAGDEVGATGTASCSGDKPQYVEVQVTQNDGDKISEGIAEIACDGTVHKWTAYVRVAPADFRRGVKFKPGDTTGVATITGDDDKPVTTGKVPVVLMS
ncbi:hypothetical protein ABZ942_39375 [Nocardia sp. NPDC046473]|uniref:hypothetical protein n=1 Tax=Nocardia sp. NPDC046473 TaxID=3155733 RepID=UPI0033C49D47